MQAKFKSVSRGRWLRICTRYTRDKFVLDEREKGRSYLKSVSQEFERWYYFLNFILFYHMKSKKRNKCVFSFIISFFQFKGREYFSLLLHNNGTYKNDKSD